MEHVMIPETQNPCSKAVETFLWHLMCLLDAYGSTLHYIFIWYRTCSDHTNHPQNKTDFYFQIDVSGKALSEF